MFDEKQRLLSPTKHRLQILYLMWSAILLVISLFSFVPVIRQIDNPFGGFVWVWDGSREPPFYVGPVPWRTQSSLEDELHHLDVIITIDGFPAEDFQQVYEEKEPGELVTYQVQRNNEILTIIEPVRSYTLDVFMMSHGLVYVTGLAYLLAGFILLRGTQRKDIAVLSFVCLLVGGAWFAYLDAADVSFPSYANWFVGLVMWIPALPLAGALLIHFAFYFPTVKSIVIRRPRITYLPYGVAGTIVLVYLVGLLNDIVWLYVAGMVALLCYAVIGIFTVIILSAFSYSAARKESNPMKRRIVTAVAAAWLTAFAIFAGLAIIPFLLLGYPLLPFEMLVTLSAILPLALVYAIRNAEMIEKLYHEIELKQRYSDAVLG